MQRRDSKASNLRNGHRHFFMKSGASSDLGFALIRPGVSNKTGALNVQFSGPGSWTASSGTLP